MRKTVMFSLGIWYVKWLGKFPHTQRIIATISRESSSTAALPIAKDHSLVQTLAPADAPPSSSSKNVKPPAKNKSFPIDNLRKNPDALLALLKWAEEAVANQEESKASLEESVAHNPYFPYDQELICLACTKAKCYTVYLLVKFHYYFPLLMIIF